MRCFEINDKYDWPRRVRKIKHKGVKHLGCFDIHYA